MEIVWECDQKTEAACLRAFAAYRFEVSPPRSLLDSIREYAERTADNDLMDQLDDTEPDASANDIADTIPLDLHLYHFDPPSVYRTVMESSEPTTHQVSVWKGKRGYQLLWPISHNSHAISKESLSSPSLPSIHSVPTSLRSSDLQDALRAARETVRALERLSEPESTLARKIQAFTPVTYRPSRSSRPSRYSRYSRYNRPKKSRRQRHARTRKTHKKRKPSAQRMSENNLRNYLLSNMSI